MCGDCCKGYGGTYVSREDIAAIAAFLQADLPDVVRQYCRFSGGKYLLEQGTDDYCVFWNKACTIHPVKPRMCRKWPFIESVVVDPFNWLIMAGSCAGMRTDVSLRQVRKCVKRFLSGSEPASKR
jgi:Fe-S-cluster containining protein